MAKVGAQRAAELTGRSKSTIQRAMNAGKLSFDIDANGRRIVDVSELDRAFGLVPQGIGASAVNGVSDERAGAELRRTGDLLELERLKMRIRMLEEQLDDARDQADDARTQRDHWQKQASQVLLTSQYGIKQAEELKAELTERDRRAKQRRQEMSQPVKHTPLKIKSLGGGNENAVKTPPPIPQTMPPTIPNGESDKKTAFDIQGLWQKIRGDKAGDRQAA